MRGPISREHVGRHVVRFGPAARKRIGARRAAEFQRERESRRHDAFALILRNTTEQTRIEGFDPYIRSDDDYSVVDDETRVGRIWREVTEGKPRRLWFAGQR